ncbi:tetratricopeptide repeat protein [Neorhizobium sp. DT-125]|uniref:tetratricopeptide repeat protein n=1 Tax=Neorhizobium sp. DT-125 TaxID=3396163 RepID=UPI003F19A25A
MLGRHKDFDPGVDPIVRVEATRLRGKLQHYYEAFGAPGTVAIHLPKGRYSPVFTRLPEQLQTYLDEVTTTIEEVEAEGDTCSSRSRRNWSRSAATSAVVLILFGTSFGYTVLGEQWREGALTERPSVIFSMTSADVRLSDEADSTLASLMKATSSFQTMRVAAEADGSTGSIGEGSKEKPRTYAVELKYFGDDASRSILWNVLAPGVEDPIGTGVETMPLDGWGVASVERQLVARLSSRFAAARGVINEYERKQHRGMLGNACVLEAEKGLGDSNVEELASARDCLSRTLAQRPDDSDAAAALSLIMLSWELGMPTEAKLKRARQLARLAVATTPFSDRAHISLMNAEFLSGNIEAAISAGNRAMSLNAANPDVSAKLSLILFSVGYWDAGVGLARYALDHYNSAAPREAKLVLALDAYRRGEYSDAALLAEQVPPEDDLAEALRIACLGQLNPSNSATQSLAAEDKTIGMIFDRMITARRIDPSVATALREGLVKAGLTPAPAPREQEPATNAAS